MECRSEGCTNESKKKGNRCSSCKNSLERYKLTLPQRKKLLESQEGKCKICFKNVEFLGRSKMNGAYVDHDHKTNKVRGIVCGVCNSWIGYVENNNLDLDNLKRYLSL